MSEFDTYESSKSSIDLSAFDNDFETVEAPSYDEVPDGKYQVRIDSVRLGQSQKGDPMIKWELLVISGPQTGRRIFRNSVITAASLPFVKGDLSTVGLQLTKFSELAGRLESLLDVTLEVTKRTRGDFANVYFNRRIQLAGNASSNHDDENTPF
ncbi:MAG: DUF669 domain-containing protein [Pirellulaceae bacterium]|nr:DUF669 domain-containing protein [Pirellulaceae bacterium]